MENLNLQTCAMRDFANISAFVSAAFLTWCVLEFRLVPAVFVGTVLFSFIRWLQQALPEKVPGKRIVGLLLALVVFFGVIVVIGFAAHYVIGPSGVEGLLLKISRILDQFRAAVPMSWQEYIPEGVDQLKAALVEQLKTHASSLSRFSKHSLHDVALLFLSVMVAVLLGASSPAVPTGVLSAPLYQRFVNFKNALAKVFAAQVKVALINSSLTGLFLLLILPAAGAHVPFSVMATVLTFLFSLIPVIGNLLSNSVIVLLGLSVAGWVALICLGFLVFVHKLEYFLSARYVGAGIGAKTWELLSAMIFLEAVYGPIGFVAAPVLYAWIKTELRLRQLI